MEYYKIEELSGVTYFKDKDLKKIQLSILKYLGEKYLKEEKSQTCQVSGLCDDAFCLIRNLEIEMLLTVNNHNFSNRKRS